MTQESFTAYFAKYLVAIKGYLPATAVEIGELASTGDAVLISSELGVYAITVIVDCETDPQRILRLTGEALRELGARIVPRTAAAWTKTRITINVFEIGAGINDAARQSRLNAVSEFSNDEIKIRCWVVDTATRKVWNNAAPFTTFSQRKEIERLLKAPRLAAEKLIPPMPVAPLPDRWPFVTYGLLLVLAAAFWCELNFGLGDYSKALEPTLDTLGALGGNFRPLVMEGEWFRLIAATFLHGDIVHLALNCIVLFIAGRMLERIVGHAWFTAIYAVSGICGSLASLAFNPPTIVSVGASGAIMGVLAAVLVLAFRFPPGKMRTRMQTIAVQVLIPSLLPLAPAATGQQVDFAGHIGGALGGAMMGGILLRTWPRQSPVPNLQSVAIAITATWMLAIAATAALLLPSYTQAQFKYELRALLIPESRLSRSHEELTEYADVLVSKYPRDPRSHLFLALKFLNRGDLAEAERSLRAALNERDILKKAMTTQFQDTLVAMLAMVLIEQGRISEARVIAKPACGRYEPADDQSRTLWERACNDEEELRRLLIPDDQLPPFEEAVARADALVKQYPRDPRAHYYHAISTSRQRNWPASERALKIALGEQKILTSLLPSPFQDNLQGMLALMIAEQGRMGDAKAAAKPVCATFEPWSDETRAMFKRLCD